MCCLLQICSRSFATAVLVLFSTASQMPAQSDPPLAMSLSNNLLTVSDARLPGGKLEIWYLEAFCRTGAWAREWKQTTLPHKTTLTRADKGRGRLEFRTLVEPGVEVRHDIQSHPDRKSVV